MTESGKDKWERQIGNGRARGFYWVKRGENSEEEIMRWSGVYWHSTYADDDVFTDREIIVIYDYQLKFSVKDKYLKRL